MGRSVIFVGAGFKILHCLMAPSVAASRIRRCLVRQALGGLAQQIGVAVGLTGPAVILYGLIVGPAPLKKARI